MSVVTDPELREPDLLLPELAGQIHRELTRRTLETPYLVGIRTGGVWVARALARLLCDVLPEDAGGLGLGQLDISFYRDDFSHTGLNPTVRPSTIPVDLTDRDVVLVDDVLYTGRTIRAALNELFDYGRPRRVYLAVLYARAGRELPICADAVGQVIALHPGEQIQLEGPEPLTARLLRARG